MEKDYHKILGVAEGASEDEIKKVFRKAALQYHPDKNKEKGAEERFKEKSEAHVKLLELLEKKNKEKHDAQCEEGHKGRMGSQNGPDSGHSSSDTFNGDSRATFSQVVGSSSPFQAPLDLNGSDGGATSAQQQHSSRIYASGSRRLNKNGGAGGGGSSTMVFDEPMDVDVDQL